MTITPTAQSSLLAGFMLWLVGWATFFHLHEVPYLGKLVNEDRILGWMNQHKLTTLIGTEVVNFGVHGVSNPAVVLFAIGGTIFNTIFIFVCLPFVIWKRKPSRSEVFQGVSA